MEFDNKRNIYFYIRKKNDIGFNPEVINYYFSDTGGIKLIIKNLTKNINIKENWEIIYNNLELNFFNHFDLNKIVKNENNYELYGSFTY